MKFSGQNMSVLGSQLEIDMDPEGEAAIVPRHQGNTGTGCYKLYDHDIEDTKKTVMIPTLGMYMAPGELQPKIFKCVFINGFYL